MPTITVLRGPRPKAPMAKVNGKPAPGRRSKYFDSFTETVVADSVDLFLLLADLEVDPYACMCLGGLGQPNEHGKWRRCLKPLPKNRADPSAGEDPPGLTAEGGAGLLVIDHDSGEYPAGTDADTPLPELAEALCDMYCLRGGLGQKVSSVVQFSGSHGLPDKGCRAKLYFPFTAPQRWEACGKYLKGRIHADPSTASPAQVLYTAAPLNTDADGSPVKGPPRTHHVAGALEAWPPIADADTDVEAWEMLHKACDRIRTIPIGEARHDTLNKQSWQVGRYVAAKRLKREVAIEWLCEAVKVSEAFDTRRADEAEDEITRAIDDGVRAPAPTRADFESLELTKDGTPKACISNAVTLLGVSCNLVENDFGDLEVLDPPPWALQGERYPALFEEGHVLRATVWLQREYHVNFTPRDVADAAKAIGAENQVDRLLEYLERVALLDEGPLTVDNIGVRGWRSDDDVAHALGASKFFIQCVKRAYEPGSKGELVLVLQGPPGTGKTRSVSALFTRPGEQYFTNGHIPIGNQQQFAPILRGLWAAELAEQRSVSKYHNDNFKTFLSLEVIKHRMPYERRASSYKLRSNYCWTTEEECPLTDLNTRRIVIVRVGHWCEANADDIDRFWGSVVRAYKEGRTCWLNDKEAEALADSRRLALNTDPLQPDVQRILKCKEVMCTLQPHLYVLHKLAGNQKYGVKVGSQKDKHRIGQIMKHLGWKRGITWDKDLNKTVRTWEPPADWQFQDVEAPPEAEVIDLY